MDQVNQAGMHPFIKIFKLGLFRPSAISDLICAEAGSCGSPLFDASRRIRGQLNGGGLATCENPIDEYGQLSVSSLQAQRVTSLEQLQPWLDPIGMRVCNGTWLSDARQQTQK